MVFALPGLVLRCIGLLTLTHSQDTSGNSYYSAHMKSHSHQGQESKRYLSKVDPLLPIAIVNAASMTQTLLNNAQSARPMVVRQFMGRKGPYLARPDAGYVSQRPRPCLVCRRIGSCSLRGLAVPRLFA